MTPYQEDIVAAAERWLETPYHHASDIIGHGVDCAMLPVRVYCDLGLVPPFDPRPYPPDWHLHQSDERYMNWVRKYADQVVKQEPGDLALFKVGHCYAHGGIVVSENVMIHACALAGRVLRADVHSWDERLPTFWRVR